MIKKMRILLVSFLIFILVVVGFVFFVKQKEIIGTQSATVRVVQKKNDIVNKLQTIEGQLITIMSDDIDSGKSDISHYLLTNKGENIKIETKNMILVGIPSGTKIKLTGQLNNQILKMEGNNYQIIEQIQSREEAIGEQKMLFLLTYLEEDSEGNKVTTPPEKPTIQEVKDTMRGVNDFYQQNSFNKLNFKGVIDEGESADVRGWYALRKPIASAYSGSVISILGHTVRVADDEIDFSKYSRVIILSDFDNANVFSGVGTYGKILLPSQDGLNLTSVVWIKRTAFINGGIELISHELGHNFHLQHAEVLRCKEKDLPQKYNDQENCIEGDDPFDNMGGVFSLGFTNPIFRFSLGWFEDNNIAEISEIGIYSKTIIPYEYNSSGLKVIKIPKVDKSYYMISFRQPIGNDKEEYKDKKNTYFNGAEIHMRGKFIGNTMNRSWIIPQNLDEMYAYVYKKGDFYDGIINENTGVLITIEDIYRDYEEPENSRLTVGIKIYKK